MPLTFFTKHSGKLMTVTITLATIFGVQVIWPRDRMETLSAQQSRVDKRIDSTNTRIDEVEVIQADQELAINNKMEEINRKLTIISILACANQSKTSLAYKLASCNKVLE